MVSISPSSRFLLLVDFAADLTLLDVTVREISKDMDQMGLWLGTAGALRLGLAGVGVLAYSFYLSYWQRGLPADVANAAWFCSSDPAGGRGPHPAHRVSGRAQDGVRARDHSGDAGGEPWPGLSRHGASGWIAANCFYVVLASRTAVGRAQLGWRAAGVSAAPEHGPELIGASGSRGIAHGCFRAVRRGAIEKWTFSSSLPW